MRIALLFLLLTLFYYTLHLMRSFVVDIIKVLEYQLYITVFIHFDP